MFTGTRGILTFRHPAAEIHPKRPARSEFTGHFLVATLGLLTPKDTQHATLPQLEGALAVRKRTEIKDEGGLGATVFLPMVAFQTGTDLNVF